MNIKVNQINKDPIFVFDVIVEENNTSSEHKVTMSKDFYNNLKTSKEPKVVIHESFAFLLSKESKEQILPNFDITLISRYFSDFEGYLSNNLS